MTDAGIQTVEGGLDDPSDLEPDQGELQLAGPDDRHSRADWQAAAAGVLRKARRLGADDPDEDVWAKLTSTTLDGIDISPLGTPDLLDGLQTLGRPTRVGPWDIRAHLHLGTDVRADHLTLITDLEGGVTSLWLTGCAADTDWATLLDGVFIDLAAVVLDGDEQVATSFLAYAEDRGLEPHTNLGIDALAITADLAAAAGTAGILGFVVDATQVHDRGASDVQELAHSLAVGATYLRAAEAAGIEPVAAAALVEFRYAATDEQLVTIAKLRAARRLWDRVLAVCGVEGAAQHQHVVTSRAMLSRYDPYVNMLRGTIAAFAAGVGGADAVTVLAFDTPLGQPEVLGRRVARNTSALLVAEAHVAAVADPAGGAYAVEKLTDDLAVAAWELFGRLEDAPDPDATLDTEIERVTAARDRQVATRKRPITGLSEFPDLAEALPERAPAPDADVRRWGAAFETLRADPPQAHVFLATMGSIAAHTARATFATNLLAAGGVAVDVAGATDGVEDLVAAHEGQPVVCLAGPDAAYDEWGEAAAQALREHGARWVIVAGKPRDWADDSCAMGIDAIEFLTATREKLA